MSRWKPLSLAIALAIMLPAACTRQSAVADEAPDIKTEISLRPDPPVVGKALIVVEISDQQGQPIEGLNLTMKGDMTHAGMTPVLGSSTYQGDGLYTVPIEWTMAGDWILQLTAEMPDGRLLKRSVNLQVSPD
ncbi:MAG: FixH family protein [Anaerolineales bacterium]|jgi:hypothetical protein